MNDILVLYFTVWTQSCVYDYEVDGIFVVIAKVIECGPWVFWISLNAIIHLIWVITLLSCQLYQVSSRFKSSSYLYWWEQITIRRYQYYIKYWYLTGLNWIVNNYRTYKTLNTDLPPGYLISFLFCSGAPPWSNWYSPFPQEICGFTMTPHINWLKQSMQLAAVSWSLADDNWNKVPFPMSHNNKMSAILLLSVVENYYNKFAQLKWVIS